MGGCFYGHLKMLISNFHNWKIFQHVGKYSAHNIDAKLRYDKDYFLVCFNESIFGQPDRAWNGLNPKWGLSQYRNLLFYSKTIFEWNKLNKYKVKLAAYHNRNPYVHMLQFLMEPQYNELLVQMHWQTKQTANTKLFTLVLRLTWFALYIHIPGNVDKFSFNSQEGIVDMQASNFKDDFLAFFDILFW